MNRRAVSWAIMTQAASLRRGSTIDPIVSSSDEADAHSVKHDGASGSLDARLRTRVGASDVRRLRTGPPGFLTAPTPMTSPYYIDESLTSEEAQRRFADDGRGREVREHGFYRLAIRRSNSPGWVFRFRGGDANVGAILATLNDLPTLR
jgi:hypothetical protein